MEIYVHSFGTSIEWTHTLLCLYFPRKCSICFSVFSIWIKIDEIKTIKSQIKYIIFIHIFTKIVNVIALDIACSSLIWFKIRRHFRIKLKICNKNHVEWIKCLDYNAAEMEHCKCHSKSAKKCINGKSITCILFFCYQNCFHSTYIIGM